MKNPDSLLSPLFFRLLIPYGTAFFIGMFIGSINSIIAPTIVSAFNLSPADLGLISSVTLISFGLTQIPLGVFLDKYGAKKTLTGMLAIAFTGILIFAASKTYLSLLTARSLIGIGFSGALMASFKSFTFWLPKKRLPLVFSIQSLMGGIGFMAATRPVSIALEYISWRAFLFVCAWVVFATVILMLTVVPDDSPVKKEGNSFIEIFKGMGKLAFDKRLFYVAPVVTATEVVLFSFSYLWIGPWLRDVAVMNERSVGLMMLLSSTGIAAGYFLNGALADYFTRINRLTWEKLYLYSGIILSLVFAVLTFYGNGRTAPLWAVVMFFSTMTMISFPIIGRLFKEEETGRIFSLLNFIIFMASFLVQWIFGVILDQYPTIDGHYSPQGYRMGMILILLMNIAAVIHLYFSIPKIEKLKKPV